MAAKVFISYRRADSAGYSGRVMDRLDRELGRDKRQVLGWSGAGWLLRRQDFGRPLSMSFLLGNLH